MKFLLLLVIFGKFNKMYFKHLIHKIPFILALSSLSCAKIVQVPNTVVPPHKCAFSCISNDMTLCATNGQCMQEFQGECLMSAYNCEHPHKPFIIIEDWKCKQSGAPKCSHIEVQQY